MSLIALAVIAGLITTVLVKSHKTAPALVAGLITASLVFATFPALGPAVTGGTAEFARQLGDATDRATTVPTTNARTAASVSEESR